MTPRARSARSSPGRIRSPVTSRRPRTMGAWLRPPSRSGDQAGLAAPVTHRSHRRSAQRLRRVLPRRSRHVQVVSGVHDAGRGLHSRRLPERARTPPACQARQADHPRAGGAVRRRSPFEGVRLAQVPGCFPVSLLERGYRKLFHATCARDSLPVITTVRAGQGWHVPPDQDGTTAHAVHGDLSDGWRGAGEAAVMAACDG